MLDKRGKLFGKVSIVDLLIVLVLIVAVLGAFSTYQKLSNKIVLTENKALLQNSALNTLEVQMRVKDVRDITVDALQVGDEVFANDTGKFLGTITAVATEPATKLIYDLSGQPHEAEIPEKKDVILTVHVPGSRLEGGYFTADNVQLVYDSSLTIKTTRIQTTPVLETITEIVGE
ncbi:MAG: DUF4330 domain-containing protein [Ruminococcaceae bacterium]|nr:DUF4330 domain-containing protein [Oscillospiraceae bacterium]